MSTVTIRTLVAAAVLGGCSQALPTAKMMLPAPPNDSVATNGREWARIQVDGSYGPIEMRVPVLTISPAQGGASSILVDSIALQQVEKRLSSRIARVARAEAASLLTDTTPPMMPPRRPAPPIQPGLLGSVPFTTDAGAVSSTQERIDAIAHMAVKTAGGLELIAEVDGTGAEIFDVALSQARRVYLQLLAAQPVLAQRTLQLTVRTHETMPGAPRKAAHVDIFAEAAR